MEATGHKEKENQGQGPLLPQRSVMIEITGDLFSSIDDDPDDAGVALVHCVSRDLRMGAGIATEFNRRFGRVPELLSQQRAVGQVAFLQVPPQYVYYLITKERYWDKPTYEDLRACLRELRRLVTTVHGEKVRELAMPRIGCGLDRLDWGRVRSMILEELGQEQNLSISVYSLSSS
jgi:O-acetyl-ADP-ribose deacetylase (regulator of RNase III)